MSRILLKYNRPTINFYGGWHKTFVLLLMIWSISAFAQPEIQWKKDLGEKLDVDSNPEYLHLVGYFDKMLFTEMFFAYDNEDWVGQIIFRDSDLHFELEGGMVDDILVFDEVVDEGRLSGYWTIRKDKEKYLANWQNPDRTMDFNLILYDEFWNPDHRKSFHRKFSVYKGSWMNENMEFEIVRNYSGPRSMMVHDRLNGYSNKIKWTCRDYLCDQFEFEYPTFEHLDSLFFARIQNDRLNIEHAQKNSEQDKVAFELKNEFETKLKVLLNERQKLSLEYPYLNDSKANRWIEKIYNKIFQDLKAQLEAVDKDDDDYGSRWKHFTDVSFKVYYWDEDLISGKWIMQKSWNELVVSLPVNYSIKENKIIKIKEEFKSDFDLDFYLLHEVHEEIKNMPENQEAFYKEYLENVAFKHFNFSREGLVLSTDFDTVFGSYELIVPYNQIRDQLGKRSELMRFIKSLENE